MQRLKRILRRLFLGLGIALALALIANAVMVWHTGRQLEFRLAGLREAGHPLLLTDLANQPVGPGPDAAAVLQRIAPDIKLLAKEIAPVLNRASGIRPLTEDDWTELARAIANHPGVIAALREASACPVYRSPLNYDVAPAPVLLGELLPHVQMHREIANILSYSARLLLRGGKADEAAELGLIGLRLARHASREPMLISHLVVMAVRTVTMGIINETLRTGPLPPHRHAELEVELARCDLSDEYVRCLHTERPYGLQSFEEMNLGGWLTQSFFNRQKSIYLDLVAEYVAHGGKKYPEFRAATDAEQTSGGPIALARSWAPSATKVLEANFRSRCLVRCLRVLNAMAAGGFESPPDHLAALRLPVDATLDPYTEQPLVVKRIEGQWIVYGLGPNLVDDGGAVATFDDIGWGPPARDR